MTRFVAFGEVLWDLLPTGAKVGGAPLNVVLHLRKQDVEAQIISKIGQDARGEQLREYLRAQGLDLTLIAEDEDYPTSTVLVKLDEGGHGSYEIVPHVAWDYMALKANAITAIERADALIFGTLAARNKVSREVLQVYLEHARARVLDVNLRPPNYQPDTVKLLMDKADVVKMNEEELDLISSWTAEGLTTIEGKMDHLLATYRIKTVLVTLGAEGAICLEKGQFFRHPGYPVEVVDTVGSGDAFLAAFLAAYYQHKGVPAALDLACATGAYVASQAGANPDYQFSDIEAFLAERSA
ncbi:MAG: carbohydrate kinase [Lewinella sp.]|nr:carbohydrate kinase [Lewinella sp.]